MYFFCRFLGYMVVVYTSQKCKALDRLVEYIRETKGNLGYTEAEIRKKAKVDKIDLIDDTGVLSGLFQIESRMEALKKEYTNKANEEIRKAERLRMKLRNLMDEMGMIDEVEDYY